jgi:glycosyltransferase involved in cell wall biosynthesis
MERLRQTDGGWPLVSIIVRTCAGRQQLLHECLRSIAAQDYRKIEIVVVEDGSAKSRNLVERFRGTTDLAVQYHGIAKVGRCRAGNQGLESASGCLLNFLDDDDQFFPNHVGVLATRLRNRPDLAAAYALSLAVRTSIRSLDPLVYRAQPGRPFQGGPFSLARLVNGNFLPIQSVMFRRELFLRHGGFDVELEQLEDWNLWTRYFATGRAEFVNETTSFFRVPASAVQRWRRKAVLESWRGRVIEKQREALAAAGVACTREFVEETERFGLLQLPLPSGIRRCIGCSRLCRGFALAGARRARCMLTAAGRLLAHAVPAKPIWHARQR